MRVEWDRAKSETNKTKHGIDFETAQLVFDEESTPTCGRLCNEAAEDRFSQRAQRRNSHLGGVHPNQISGAIVDAAYKIHRGLGPGLLESVYEAVLAKELMDRGFSVVRQVPIPLVYGGMEFPVAYRADLVVDDTILCELKSVEAVTDVHKKQLLTYLRLANKPLGLLINFNVALIKQGITRVVNGLR